MPGIADTNTIDLVAQDGDGTYLLVMVEERPWGAEPDQATQLQAKINTYVGYILNGSLVRQFPETAARPVAIRLDCETAPTGHFAHVAAHAAHQLAARGIEFRISPRD